MKLYFLIKRITFGEKRDANGYLPLIQSDSEYIIKYYHTLNNAKKYRDMEINSYPDYHLREYGNIIKENIYVKEVDISKGVIINE